MPPARYGARQGTNPPPAVAEADNGLGGTSQDRFDEPVVIDAAIVAADDHRYVATRIDCQGGGRRFRYRRDAVVDKKHTPDFAELLLPVRQSAKPAGSLERRRHVDIERFHRRKRCAQIGFIVRSGEVGIAYSPYTLARIEDIDAARVNAIFVIVQIFSRSRCAAEPFHELCHLAVDDAASAAAEQIKFIPKIVFDRAVPVDVLRMERCQQGHIAHPVEIRRLITGYLDHRVIGDCDVDLGNRNADIPNQRDPSCEFGQYMRDQ